MPLYLKENFNNIQSKSDKSYVDSQSTNKADKSYVDNQLTNKADKSYVDSQLTNKADKSYVDTQLNNKLNTSEVVTTATPNKVLKLDANGKLPASITGDAATVGGYTAQQLISSASVSTVEYVLPFTSSFISSWSTKAPMPTARYDLTSSVVNGIIYAIGGFKDGSRLNTVEAYDPSTNTWTTRTPMPTARNYLTSSVVNGIIYAIGGINSSYLNTVEAYDPSTNTWTTRTPMPTARSGLTSSVVS